MQGSIEIPQIEACEPLRLSCGPGRVANAAPVGASPDGARVTGQDEWLVRPDVTRVTSRDALVVGRDGTRVTRRDVFWGPNGAGSREGGSSDSSSRDD